MSPGTMAQQLGILLNMKAIKAGMAHSFGVREGLCACCGRPAITVTVCPPQFADEAVFEKTSYIADAEIFGADGFADQLIKEIKEIESGQRNRPTA